MHERSLVRALLRQVHQVADEHSAGRVVSIHVRVGEFSGVDPDLLASAYDDLVSQSPLRGAALEVQRVPLDGVCDRCGSVFRIERFSFQCSQCGCPKVQVRGGDEILLDSVTMEEAEA